LDWQYPTSCVQLWRKAPEKDLPGRQKTIFIDAK